MDFEKDTLILISYVYLALAAVAITYLATRKKSPQKRLKKLREIEDTIEVNCIIVQGTERAIKECERRKDLRGATNLRKYKDSVLRENDALIKLALKYIPSK